MEHTTVPANGINLHVVQAGPDDGPLVLLLHGFPEFWYGWRRQIDVLAAAGYRVWAPDQRGYNLSDKPTGLDAYTIDELAADVVGLIDAAGCDRASVVGHDWGAAVAWWTANKISRADRETGDSQCAPPRGDAAGPQTEPAPATAQLVLLLLPTAVAARMGPPGTQLAQRGRLPCSVRPVRALSPTRKWTTTVRPGRSRARPPG